MCERVMYLGLPAIVGWSKKEILAFIKNRNISKIKGWKGKFLSQAGKEVLLKSVLAAIPSYAMSCFQIPDGLCKEITNLFSNFWWGTNDDKRKIHFEKWEKLCELNFKGGLDFRDLKAFNMAL